MEEAKEKRKMGLNRRRVLLGSGAAAVAGAGAVSLSFLTMGSSDDYAAAMAVARAALPPAPDLKELVRFATLAANGHNTQPWRFRLSDGRIDILPDLSRRTPIVDPDDHHLYVNLGCAAANLALTGAASGRPGTLRFDGSGDGAIVFEFASGAAAHSPLFEAILLRQSTRAEYDGKSVAANELNALSAAAAIPGVAVMLITDRPQFDRIRDLVIEGNTAQMADAAFVAELKQWIRFNPRDALQMGDGLYSAASGNPTLPSWLGPIMFDLAFQMESENDKYARHLRSSAGFAVFIADEAGREGWMRVGQACQRFALQATALGLKHAFVNQPVEVARLRPELASLIGMPGRRPDLVMRFGFGPALPMSPRRPVAAVIA
jgi:nitroreductase